MRNNLNGPVRLPLFAAALAGVCGLLCFSGVAGGAEASRRPNFVVILADDLGWSDLGCYGADLHETPHLDRLARQGVRFTQAYSASICSPTRAALMTGKHYARLHMTIWYEASQRAELDEKLIPPTTVADLPHSETTIAKRLQAAGYLTALVGKWHLGAATHYPETHGFDVNVGGTMWGAPHTYYYPYRGAGRFGDEFRYVPHLENGKSGEYLTDRFTDEALKIIDSAGERPFFLYLAHHAVHTPIEPKPELVEHYQKKITPALKHQNAKYAAMVQSLDESVGRVMDHLDRNKLSDNTYIVFLSDNGGQISKYDGLACTSNAPLRSGKGSLYEGGVRVPFIVRGPGIGSPGSECHEPVQCMDVLPTLVELAGLPLPAADAAALDGMSLVPLLKKTEATLARPALFFHYPHYYSSTTPVSAVRAGDWKLLEYLEDGRLELYQLRDDPYEQHDLAARSPDKAAELRQQLHTWRTSIGAQMPTANPEKKTGG